MKYPCFVLVSILFAHTALAQVAKFGMVNGHAVVRSSLAPGVMRIVVGQPIAGIAKRDTIAADGAQIGFLPLQERYSLSVQEVSGDPFVQSIVPNPATNTITLTPISQELYTWQILNLQGATELSSGSVDGQQTIGIGLLATGTYTVVIQSGNNVSSYKLVVVR
jgi:hypothetical protein